MELFGLANDESVLLLAMCSFFMLRRYKNAVNVVGSLCTHMQREFKVCLYAQQHIQQYWVRDLFFWLQYFFSTDQFRLVNLANCRMIALLALCTHLCPSASVETSISKGTQVKHSAQLSKESSTNLFVFCSTKFVSPAQALPKMLTNIKPIYIGTRFVLSKDIS